MSYVYLSKVVEILSGTAFHSFTYNMSKNNTLENRLHLGNFYHTINLKAKKIKLWNRLQKDIGPEVTLQTYQFGLKTEE